MSPDGQNPFDAQGGPTDPFAGGPAHETTSETFDPESFDPLAPGNLSQPFDQLSLVRAQAPIFYMAPYGMWHVAKYADVRKVFRDPHTYSSAHVLKLPLPPSEIAPSLPDGYPLEGAPVNTDPPRHVQVRRLLQTAFTPQVVAARGADIREITDTLVDEFVDEGSVEIVDGYASQIPPWVVTQLLGVPPGDRETFRRWALTAHDVAFAPPDLSEQAFLDLSREMVEFDEYVRGQIEERRKEPRPDLTSDFVHATTKEGDPSLTAKELIGTIASMVAAGSDTTSTLIAHTVYLLLINDGAWERVASDRELVPQAIEESLRLLPPARAMRRTTTEATALRGVDIPKGETLYLNIASANRDADVFDEPDKFDLERDNSNRHLSLGHGVHSCLGAPLARLEAKVALESLLERIPEMRLANDQVLDDSAYETNAFVPSLRRMRVEWSR